MSSAPVIVAAHRTPIGKFKGGLSTLRPDDLLALVFKYLVESTKLNVEEIDDVISGCANQAGEDNRNVSRMAALIAGLPDSVPAVTINRLCGSSMEAAIQASRAIKCGDGNLFLVGGVESMSRAPWSMPKPQMASPVGHQTLYDTVLGWRYPNPKLEARFPLEAMGKTAENLAERYNISRADQDAYAFASHQKALAAQAAGRFDSEIIAVDVQNRKQVQQMTRDEGPRSDSNLEKLAALNPAFLKGGSVTAGNSSTLNDGAAGLVLCHPDYAVKNELPQLARIVGSAVVGVDPRYMGYGPVPATQKLLQKLNWNISEVDVFEINEAFSAQSLAVIKGLDIPPEKVNLNGGAIALGHPLGCSGARIITTLLHIMQQQGKRRGIATMCIGVGQGIAIALENDVPNV